MPAEHTALKENARFDRNNYNVGSLQDELRITQLCKQLLQDFYQHLMQEHKLDPVTATVQASGADYFLHDFMIDHQRANIFDGSALYLEKFAANWYIISTLEPNIEELRGMLDGTANFYAYCAGLKLIEQKTSTAITAASLKIDYYHQRIESFLDISGDGYIAWEQERSLK